MSEHDRDNADGLDQPASNFFDADPRLAFWLHGKPNTDIRLYLPLLNGQRYTFEWGFDSEDFRADVVRYLVAHHPDMTPQACMSLTPERIAAILKADWEARPRPTAAATPSPEPTKAKGGKRPGAKVDELTHFLGHYAYARVGVDADGKKMTDRRIGVLFVQDHPNHPVLGELGPKFTEDALAELVKRCRQAYGDWIVREAGRKKGGN